MFQSEKIVTRPKPAIRTALIAFSLIATGQIGVSNVDVQASGPVVREVVNIDFTTTSITGGTIANAGAQSTGSLTVFGAPTGSGTANGLTFANETSAGTAQYLTGSLGDTTGISKLVIEMVARFPDSGCSANTNGSMVFALGGSNPYNIYRHSNIIGYNTFASDIFGTSNLSRQGTYHSYKFVMTPIPDLPSAQEIWIDGVKQDLAFRTTSFANNDVVAGCSNINGVTENSAGRVLSSDGTFLFMTHSLGVNTWKSTGSIKSLKITTTTGAQAPSAPTIGAITSGDSSLSVPFTAPGSNGGSAITNYEYSIDNGATWITRNPQSASSPITIGSLTNGTSYQVKVRAVNSAGPGAESAAVAATPAGALSIAGAPSIDSVTPGDGGLSIAFTPPAYDGGAPISNYKYSLDDGATWLELSPPQTTSPIALTGLTNGTSYQIKLRAVNSQGDGTPSASEAATPVSPPVIAIRPVPPTPAVASLSMGASLSGRSMVRVRFAPNARVPEGSKLVLRLINFKGKDVGKVEYDLAANSKSLMVPMGFTMGRFNVEAHVEGPAGNSQVVRLAPTVVNAPRIESRTPLGKPILRGTKATEPILFAPNSSQLGTLAQKQLNSLVRQLKATNSRIALTGFTATSMLGAAFEKELATERAKVVANYLKSRGLTNWIYFHGVGNVTNPKDSAKARKVAVRVLP